MKICQRPSYGFTLIELMMVSTIIGLLAAIAIPKFGNLIIKAKEAAVKGKLGAFRSALMIYYADTEGYIPSSSLRLTQALVPKYIGAIPSISIPTVPSHVPNNLFTDGRDEWDGAWEWETSGGKMNLYIKCFHPDSAGRIWSTW